MKYVSWNVNGLRSCLRKGFLDFVRTRRPDALCLQEVRALPEQVELELSGYHQFWNPATKRGYSGVMILSRVEPSAVRFGMGEPEHDAEGRVLTLEFEDHYLVTVYTPNSRRELVRLPYRQRWDARFLSFLQSLEAEKPVVFCGDLNVSHQPIDLANPRSNTKNAGFTPEERAGFQAFVDAGFVDTFRLFESGGGHYTWWTYRHNARERNIGWRLDYFLASRALKDRVRAAGILADVHGSDHCPVSVELALQD